jgi:transposase-like protein
MDTLGRVRTPRERREAIVDEFERSGVSGVEFARLIGVKYPTLANWVQRRRTERASALPPALPGESRRQMRWVEAVVAPPGQGGHALRVELPGGARLEIADGAQVALAAALLRALDSREAAPC